ncbi:hypothetical protein SAMN05421640_0161 [Ekhidna lutea]|uniref:DUF6265 domain-containing protein n=1 Tax=Ekhidna lutea TaxID=447679 RepID=A0A239EHZ6_EKHLU|nr:DUF6265 family protein [Ekhidna lutea]SNS44266.1 hypothetical protein SAMN05421640_0161 [Ekhidna lutea]
MKVFNILTAILIFSITSLHGQNTDVPYAWLAGSWTGDGFGGTSEEVWSLPSADGTMMGTYRHHKGDGSLNFYEFMVMDSTGLRLKHFNPDMTGWETKEDFVHFKAIEFTEDMIVLKGLVFERKSDDEIEIRLDLKNGDKAWTEVFKMKRK